MNALKAIQVFFLALVMAASGEVTEEEESLALSAAQILSDYDANKDGKISLEEVPYQGATETLQKKMEAAFHAADKNGDGLLTPEEIPEMVKLTTEVEKSEAEEGGDREGGEGEEHKGEEGGDREGGDRKGEEGGDREGEERKGEEGGDREGGNEEGEDDLEDGLEDGPLRPEDGPEDGPEDRPEDGDKKPIKSTEPIVTTDDDVEIMTMHDENKDGKLSWEEVIGAIHWESDHHNSLVQEAFSASDADKDEHLGVDELKQMVQTLKDIKSTGRHLESEKEAMERHEAAEAYHHGPNPSDINLDDPTSTADDFQALHHHAGHGDEDDPQKVLVRFDLNQDNKLGWDEMLKSFTADTDGEEHTREHQDMVLAAFKKADSNHDAFVDEHEIEDFVELMQNAESAQQIEDDEVEISSHQDGTRAIRHHNDPIAVDYPHHYASPDDQYNPPEDHADDNIGPEDHLHEL